MKKLEDLSREELWQIFPIFLVPHHPNWIDWYHQKEKELAQLLSQFELKFNHIGSTAIPTIQAKPIIDILLETSEKSILPIHDILMSQGWRLMSTQGLRHSYNFGYTIHGYAPQVFHLHVRPFGDHDELYFREYLLKYPQVAKSYETMKLELARQYKHHRANYTDGKTTFIKEMTEKAKLEFNLEG